MRVLVVDDDPDVAKTIENALRRSHTVFLALSGVQGIQQARQVRPDVVILDIVMPGMDGFEVCRRLRDDPVLSDTPILFLTARGRTEDRIQGFQLGADDYMTKPFSVQELDLRMQAIMRRAGATAAPAAADGLIRVGDIGLNTKTYEVQVGDRTALLTPIEFELLYHFMAHPGEVFSTHRLLQEVWDYPTDTGSPDLVRMHVRNLRGKIEPDPSHPTYLVTVSRHGYSLKA
ncbi:MAG: response regulator transcription factor [Anaerolineae bacterium]|nr:response regulator transcription factor [Anaerolineae bacterium]